MVIESSLTLPKINMEPENAPIGKGKNIYEQAIV